MSWKTERGGWVYRIDLMSVNIKKFNDTYSIVLFSRVVRVEHTLQEAKIKALIIFKQYLDLKRSEITASLNKVNNELEKQQKFVDKEGGG